MNKYFTVDGKAEYFMTSGTNSKEETRPKTVKSATGPEAAATAMSQALKAYNTKTTARIIRRYAVK